MLQLNSDMPTHCFNVGAMLQINMLCVNVGPLLQLPRCMSTRCSNVGPVLHVNMLSFNVGPMLKLNSDMQDAGITSPLIKGKRGRERCQHIVSMLVQCCK